MNMTSAGRLATAASLFLLLLAPARADDPPGILWETTSQMSMPGMPSAAPQQSMKVCTPRVWTKPPPGGDNTCVNSDFVRTGNKVTWKTKCSGRMAMTGTGEITFAKDGTYTGAINATAAGRNITINLSGRKLGTCDKPSQ